MAVSSRSSMESKVAASWPTSSSVPWSPSRAVEVAALDRRRRRRDPSDGAEEPTEQQVGTGHRPHERDEGQTDDEDEDPVLIRSLLGQVGRDDDGADGAMTAQ